MAKVLLEIIRRLWCRYVPTSDPGLEHNRDYLWIGDSGYAVQFEAGKAVYVGSIKG
jgi:hypothetical protein